MLGLVPLALQVEQCPWNLNGWVGLTLIETRLDQRQTPVVSVPGGAAMGGQCTALPWGGVECIPVGLEHRSGLLRLPGWPCAFHIVIVEVGWDSRLRLSTVECDAVPGMRGRVGVSGLTGEPSSG